MRQEREKTVKILRVIDWGFLCVDVLAACLMRDFSGGCSAVVAHKNVALVVAGSNPVSHPDL